MVSWALRYLHTYTENCLFWKPVKSERAYNLKILTDMIRCLFDCLIYLIRTTLREMRIVMVMKILLNVDGSSIFYDHLWSVLTEVKMLMKMLLVALPFSNLSDQSKPCCAPRPREVTLACHGHWPLPSLSTKKERKNKKKTKKCHGHWHLPSLSTKKGRKKRKFNVMGIGIFPACRQNNKSQAQNPERQNITFRSKYSFRPLKIK